MSARTLRITLTALTVAGLGVAGYLTYVHYAGINPVCTAGGSCEKVQTSVYSQLAGVPVALIGLLGYISISGSPGAAPLYQMLAVLSARKRQSAKHARAS